jgi:hypothetical protein
MNVLGAIVAGVVGTLMLSLALRVAPQMGLPPMDFLGLLGTLFSRTPNRIVGWVLHLLIGILFGLLYAAVWATGLIAVNVTLGALVGVAHWLLAGLLLGVLPSIHAGIRAGTQKAPGRYLRGWDAHAGFYGGLMAHIVYGMTVALVYGIFRL